MKLCHFLPSADDKAEGFKAEGLKVEVNESCSLSGRWVGVVVCLFLAVGGVLAIKLLSVDNLKFEFNNNSEHCEDELRCTGEEVGPIF